MSLIGRLWSRAPAWRLSLVTAVACTGMAAMFPPTLPALWSQRLVARAHPGTGTTDARFHPTAPAALPDTDELHGLPNDPGRQGIIPLAGRLIPLPAGTWRELVAARLRGSDLQQVLLLGRIEDNRLTGLIELIAPSVMTGAAGSIGVLQPCLDNSRIAGVITPPAPGDSPLTHECWALAAIDMHALASAQPGQAGQDDVMLKGLGRLGELGVKVPPGMLQMTYNRSDDTGWIIAAILLPGTPGRSARVRDWAARFAVALHKGFDRTLTRADLTPAITRDPG